MKSATKGFKTVFYGGTIVGKSTIISRLVTDGFIDGLPCTIGVAFTRLYYNEKKYDIWDTAGQARFYSLSPMYFRNADVEIFVFDVSNEQTIFELNHYEKYLQGYERSKIILVGNKIDLISSEKLIEIQEFAKNKIQAMGMTDRVYDFAWVSAKTGAGIDSFLGLLDAYSQNIKIRDTSEKKDIKNLDESGTTTMCCW